MKTKISLIAIAAIVIAACSTSKKSSTSTATTTPAATTTQPTATTPSNNNSTPATATVAKSTTGIFVPGDEELVAIKTKYQDVTLDKLKEGHTVYTTGACVSCHNAKNIYRRPEGSWKEIIEDMAKKAQISDTQKDALYKYVLAIKATQPKEAK